MHVIKSKYLDPEKLKQLQQQDEYITKFIANCKSSKNNETLCYLDEHGITYRKITDGPHIFHCYYAFLKPCSGIFCMSAIMHWDTMVPLDCTILLEETITGKSYVNVVTNMYIHVQNANKKFSKSSDCHIG